jgi:hypothetical protein
MTFAIDFPSGQEEVVWYKVGFGTKKIQSFLKSTYRSGLYEPHVAVCGWNRYDFQLPRRWRGSFAFLQHFSQLPASPCKHWITDSVRQL